MVFNLMTETLASVADKLECKAGLLGAVEEAVGSANRLIRLGRSDKAPFWFQVVSILLQRRAGGPTQDLILMQSALHRGHLDTAQLWMNCAYFRLRRFEARQTQRAADRPEQETQKPHSLKVALKY